MLFAQKLFLAGLLSLASVFSSALFQEKVTPQMLKEKYARGTIQILVVPGHDNESYGAEFRGLTEARVNAELGKYLYEFLRSDEKFIPFLTRNGATGELNDWFLDYLKKERAQISNFRKKVKSITKNALQSGEIVRNIKVYHNPAADNTSLNLYGINKWANENNIDIVVHIHFNDYPGRVYNKPGEYSGFAIYVPERQLPNSRASIAIAQSVKETLVKFFKTSDFPKEQETIIQDQQLIAVGANASREGASFLMEYGYIYEPQIHDAKIRSVILKELAYQTYRGIKNYFLENPENANTTLLPYH